MKNLTTTLKELSKKQKTFILGFLLILSLTNALNFALNLTPIKILDQKGEAYINSTLVKVGAAFVMTRAINSAISIFQESTVDISPAGIGVTIALGEFLDPINDFIEKTSYILFLSTISLSIQKVVLELGPTISVNFLLSIALIFFIMNVWFKEKIDYDFFAIGGKIVAIAILVRLLIPTVGLVNDTLYNTYFSAKLSESMNELEKTQEQVNEVEGFGNTPTEDQSLWTKIKGIKNAVNIDNIKNKLETIKNSTANIFDKLITIATIFIIQTIIIPLLTLWLMKIILIAILGKTTATSITDKVDSFANKVSKKGKVPYSLNPRMKTN